MPVDPHLLALFTLTTLVAMVVPGPDMLFVLGCGMRGGPRVGLLATAGVATSEVVHVGIAAAGLAALLAAVPVAFTAVRVAGAAYLIVLGVRTIRRRHDEPARLPAGAVVSGRRAYLSGLATNLLNPKMIAFYLSLLPQFVPAGAAVGWSVLLVAIHIALGFTWSLVLVYLAGRASAFFRRPVVRRWLNRVTASVLVALGVRMAVAQGG